MIELVIGAAIVGGYLLLNKKNNADAGSGSENYFKEDGFVPGQKQSKVAKGFETANQAISTGASAMAVAQGAGLTLKRSEAAKALAEKNKANKKAAKQDKKANKSPKQNKARIKEFTEAEKKVLRPAFEIVKRFGIPPVDEDMVNEIIKISNTKAIKTVLKNKGATEKEIAILIKAAAILRKYKKQSN